MTDIEKRAYNYAEAIYGDTEKDIEWSIARDGYEFGAKKQLKIDIDNACTALCKILCQMDKASGLSCPCRGYKQLVKAMEGDEK